MCTSNGLPNGLAFTSFVAGTAFSVSDTANGGNPTYYIALEYNAAQTPIAQSSAILTFPNSQIIAGLSPAAAPDNGVALAMLSEPWGRIEG